MKGRKKDDEEIVERMNRGEERVRNDDRKNR
jgi:hypothetical protein